MQFNIIYYNLTLFSTCSYRSYKARKQLAAIDWNFHLNQAVATNKAGDMIVSRKYNQRTKEWNSKIIKVKKEYDYIPVLMAKIFKMRKEDVNKVTRNVPLNDSDPPCWHQQSRQSQHHLRRSFSSQGRADLKNLTLLKVQQKIYKILSAQ